MEKWPVSRRGSERRNFSEEAGPPCAVGNADRSCRAERIRLGRLLVNVTEALVVIALPFAPQYGVWFIF